MPKRRVTIHIDSETERHARALGVSVGESRLATVVARAVLPGLRALDRRLGETLLASAEEHLNRCLSKATGETYCTVAELEAAWSSNRDEWELLGPAVLADDERLRFVWCGCDEYAIERVTVSGDWYPASDDRYGPDDVEALRR